VVSELVSLQGGRVWVEGADGGGARFLLELPLVKAPTGLDAHAVAQQAAT